MEQHQKFLAKINKIKGGCWEWLGGKSTKGYGVFYHNGKTVRPYRYSYEHYVGPIPAGLTIDHLCDNPPCVNPKHLKPATMKENVLRSSGLTAINARKTDCKRGHPLSGRNLVLRKRGRAVERRCRRCAYDSTNTYKRQARADLKQSITSLIERK